METKEKAEEIVNNFYLTIQRTAMKDTHSELASYHNARVLAEEFCDTIIEEILEICEVFAKDEIISNPEIVERLVFWQKVKKEIENI